MLRGTARETGKCPMDERQQSVADLAEEDTGLAVRDLSWKTDVLSDGGETMESSHRWADEVESEALEVFEVWSNVEETLTAITVSVMGKGRYRRVRSVVAEIGSEFT